eukprot:TRINITY_DN3132_c0_g1_i13.p1 TRINITY_DN3132_c0_g1~~TRINITY_DN3132_c0_g1_i13.p1  ORF type:complete len:465 (+),score=116.83 TRINITY_DN3132_c0_g1_i13:30-1397(+)
MNVIECFWEKFSETFGYIPGEIKNSDDLTDFRCVEFNLKPQKIYQPLNSQYLVTDNDLNDIFNPNKQIKERSLLDFEKKKLKSTKKFLSDASETGLRDVYGITNDLSWCEGLEELLSFQNDIQYLSSLSKTTVMDKVTDLSLENKDIDIIDERIVDFRNLVSINLMGNDIEVIKCVPASLKSLNLNSNDIYGNLDLSHSNLIHLSLAYNRITVNSFDTLIFPSSLVSLDLSYNNISTLAIFDKIASLGLELKYLALKGNPITFIDGIYDYICLKFPDLISLDYEPIDKFGIISNSKNIKAKIIKQFYLADFVPPTVDITAIYQLFFSNLKISNFFKTKHSSDNISDILKEHEALDYKIRIKLPFLPDNIFDIPSVSLDEEIFEFNCSSLEESLPLYIRSNVFFVFDSKKLLLNYMKFKKKLFKKKFKRRLLKDLWLQHQQRIKLRKLNPRLKCPK